MKKWFLISLASLACITTACSDDDDNRCTADYRECKNDVLQTCSSDGRIQKTQCATTCSIINGRADCDSYSGQPNIPLNCADIGEVGKCVGNTVYYCENDELKSEVCNSNQICALDAKNLYNCIDSGVGPGPGPHDGCGNVDAKGKCDGNKALVCVNGKLESKQCGANQTCGQRDDGQVDCLSSSENSCGNIDGHGVCENNVITFCGEGNKLQTLKCTENETCDKDDNDDYICFKNAEIVSDDCDLPSEGKCDENHVLYCSNDNKTLQLTCNEDEICAKDKSGVFNCIPKDSDPDDPFGCGDINAVGKCDGNVVTYCEMGKGLVTETCAPHQKCGKNENGYNDCLDQKCGKVTAYGKCEKGNVLYCDTDTQMLASSECSVNETCDKDAEGFYYCFKNYTEEASNCDSLDDEAYVFGKCEGQKVLFCGYDKNENEKLMSYMCNDDEKCMMDPINGVYDCIVPIPCGDVDDVGKCDGNVISYCDVESDLLVSYDCGEEHTCGMNTEENYYDCLEKEDPDACGKVDVKGSCKDGKATYCGDDNKLHTDACTKDQECKADDNGNFRCIDKAPADPCKGIDAKGKCDGNKATYCDANVLKTDECTKDQECKADDNGNFRCIDKAPADPCKGIDAKGKCEDNQAIYCDANVLKTDACNKNQECKADDNGNFRCIDVIVDPNACGEVDKKGSCKDGKAIYCGDDNKLHTDECNENQECKADDNGNFRCADVASIDPCEKCKESQKCEKDESGEFQCIDPTE